MSKEEVIKLLTVIEATYPSFKVSDRASTLSAWAVVLEPYSADLIGDAFITYTRTNASKFAPSPAELIGIANSFDEDFGISIEDRIANIRRAICDAGYHAEYQFSMLDRVEQRAVGNPHNLKAWSQLPANELEVVIMSQLRKSLSIAEQRENELAAMPERSRLLIEKTAAKLRLNCNN